MGTKITKITSKYQTTIPKEVRKKLNIKIGDSIVFELLKDGIVRLKKALPLDIQFAKSLNSTLSEWESKEDEEAYRKLQDL